MNVVIGNRQSWQRVRVVSYPKEDRIVKLLRFPVAGIWLSVHTFSLLLCSPLCIALSRFNSNDIELEIGPFSRGCQSIKRAAD